MSGLSSRQSIAPVHDDSAPAPAPTPTTAQDISNASHVPSSASGNISRSSSDKASSASPPTSEPDDALITSHPSSHGSKSPRPSLPKTRSSTSRNRSSGTVKSPDGLKSDKRPQTSSSRGPGSKRARFEGSSATPGPGDDLSVGNAASSTTQASTTGSSRSGISSTTGNQAIPVSLALDGSSSPRTPPHSGSSPISPSWLDVSPRLLPTSPTSSDLEGITVSTPSSREQSEEAFSSLITSKLPNEVFHKVVEHLGRDGDLSTLARLLRTSNAAYTAVAPTLYGEVVITRKNAKSFYLGLMEHHLRAPHQVSPTGISWEEFKDPKHNADCEAANEARVKATRRERQVRCVWPQADIDSDEESQSVNGDSSDHDVLYPTNFSVDRKSNLLALVQRLHFAEMPSTAVCLNLARNTYLNKLPEMSKLRSISLRPRAVWQIVDWTDRHLDTEAPFTQYLRELPAHNVCIQMPVIDHHLEKSYMSSRIVSADYHTYRDRDIDGFDDPRRPTPTQHAYLRGYLSEMTALYLPRVSNSVGWLTTCRLVVHNCVVGLRSLMGEPLGSCQIFYRPCVCRDHHVTDKIDDLFCYNHFNPTVDDRIDPYDLPEPEDVPPNMNVLELVDFDWRTGTIDNAIREDAIVDRLKAGIARQDDSAKEFLQRVVKFKDSTEVQPCECCGNKQLTYEQSSIKFSD